MRTDALFWKDPYQKEFEAKVISSNGREVVLDRTCFFPQGGGQVGDTGFLNDARVVDTRKDAEYSVTHFLERESAFKEGETVKGRIDWERRYRIMKLHSAAHIVYYLMIDVFGENCKLASSGIVNERKDITDYLTESFDRERLAVVERRANELIGSGGEIRTWSDESKPNYRYWEIDGFPKMPCGGTHPKRLEEIGEIVVQRGKKPGAGKERVEILLKD
ncbi:MAG: alanyl-tRNA editing protein [Candidatus Micrarchaeota archaeon]|nr:alanyl-tRNA editing protein [Candidatus Micrarchaeota archaeon]